MVLREAPGGAGPRLPVFLRTLGPLIRKASAYRGLLGIFARSLPGCVDILLVAPRPMTGAIRALAGAWGSELRLRYPWSAWNLSVSGVSPSPHLGYCCLYWRPCP